MKHLFTTTALLFSMTAFAQVGINNTSPKATLDITAKTSGTKPEGLIIPQLAGSDIHTATAAGVYGSAQKGLIIYATSADSSPTSATANITAAGYYYFDGTNWQKVMTGSVANADLTTGVGGIYKGSGSLSGNTTVTQGANTLAFNSTATNGFSVDGTTLSIDGANHRVGIGTATPASRLVLENDNNADDYDDLMINTYSTTATPSILLTQSRGTKATPANLQNGDIMGGFNFRGRANGTSSIMSTINSIYRGNGTTVLSDLNFSTSGTTKMRIDENGNVGIGTNAPNTNAALDVSSNTKGVKLPSLALTATNSASPLSAHVAGMLVYNTATAGTAPNNVVPGLYTNDGTQWILLQTPQTVNVSAPAGTVSYTAASTVPTGYLECNGAAVSRTTYATLFAAIGTTYGTGDGSTTFNLPDLRGEFVRGWDHGRGADASRSLGSAQSNSTKLPNTNFTGTTSTYTHNHGVGNGASSTNTVNAGVFGLLRRSVSGEGNTPANADAANSGSEPDIVNTPRVIPNDSHSHTVAVDGGGDTETRPRNIALMPIIKF